MKSVSDLARKNFLALKPCVHGADTLEAAAKAGVAQSDLLDFSSSVNPLGTSDKALVALQNSLGQISSYPDSNSTILRVAIAANYKGLSKTNVVVGNGSTELIYLFAEAFLQRGDVALVAAPTFGEYESAVNRAGAQVKHVKLSKTFHVEPSRFVRAMSKSVKTVFLCNPNNPTSLLAKEADLVEIIQSASERDILVFLDEDFLEFVDNGEKLSLINKIDQFPNLFVLRSFTKIFGLTGLRIGYGATSKEIAGILLNAKIPWNLNCLAQAAAVAALGDKEHLNKTLALIKAEKAYLLAELAKLKALKVYPADANFLFINIKKTGFTAAQLKARLLKYGMLIRDCSSFAGLDKYYIRIAVKTRPENQKIVEALKKTIPMRV